MQKILDKAREGGYDKLVGSNYELVCDPEFFQSLAKACGWIEMLTQAKYERFFNINYREGWEKAVAYLEELIK